MGHIRNLCSLVIMMLLIVVSTVPVFGNSTADENYSDIIFNYSFSKPKIEKVEIKGEIFDRVTIDGLSNTRNYQEPCLPVKPLRILLPRGKDVKDIRIITDEKTILGVDYKTEIGGRVIPLVYERQVVQNQIFIKNESIKFTVEDYPSCLYSKVGVYAYRGFSILHVNLHPVQFNMKTGEIYYFNHMTLIVETKESKINKAFRGLPRDFELVTGIVDNPSYIDTYNQVLSKKSFPTETYEYIIITSNKLKNADGGYNFQDLADFKNANGVSSKIVTVEEIMLNPDYQVTGKWGDANPDNPFYNSELTGDFEKFNDKSARIRNFIRYAYSEWETNYVLLGGDADVATPSHNIIPLRGLFANESGLPLNPYADEEQEDIPSDVYYACLDGNFNYDCDLHFGESPDRNDVANIDEADLYAEVWVGRCCADSAEEVSNFVMKTLQYAQTTDDLYLSKIMFVGEDLGGQFYYQYGGDYKDMIEYLVPSSYNMNKLYDNFHFTWYPEDFIQELYSIQPQIINHDGHGYPDYMLKMGSDNFYAFQNEKPFFIYSHSCLTGSFDNYYPGGYYSDEDCIAEILTCEIPYGAYACILNARYGLGSENSPIAPSGSYDESFYKALFTENIRELGGASHFSKEDNVWRINENGYRWCYYQTNLFGDPQLRVKYPNEIPPNKPMTPSGQTNGKIGSEYTYSTSTTDPSNYDLYYLFDWGDGTFSSWLGPYPSGETCEAKYTWGKSGNYIIKVKAKNSNEVQSQWSDPVPINMPKNNLLSNNLQKGNLDTNTTSENGVKKPLLNTLNMVLFILHNIKVTAEMDGADLVKFILEKKCNR
jgi:hypothetical protein